MRVLCLLHGYPPYHNAGAETMAHAINRRLASRGHQVTVLVRPHPAGALDLDGVSIRQRGPARWVDREAKRADVLITHLDETPIATEAARRVGVPLVHVIHNDRQLDHHGVTPATAAGLIVNSHWIAAELPDRFAQTPRVVVWPPTFPEEHDTDPSRREVLTLVNPLEAKGAPLVYELARRLPERRFLIVTGSYGAQIRPPDLPNIELRRNRPDMGPVWRRTRLLLAPSSYESFGKAAAEAQASAIPVLAHPTEGLRENLAGAGIFVDRDDPDAWVEVIAALDDPDRYELASKAARARAEEAGAIIDAQLDELETFLEELAG